MSASSAHAFGPSSLPDFHDDLPAIQELVRKQRISLKPADESLANEDPVTRVQELSQEITLLHQKATRVLGLGQPVDYKVMRGLVDNYYKLQDKRWIIIKCQILGPLATESRGPRPGFLKYFAQVAVYCDLQHLYHDWAKRVALFNTWIDLDPMPTIDPREASQQFNNIRQGLNLFEKVLQKVKSRVETNLFNLINDKRYEECLEHNQRMSCFAEHARDIATSPTTQSQANQTPIQSAWTVSSWFPLPDGAEEIDESEWEVVSQDRMVEMMDVVSFEIGKKMGLYSPEGASAFLDSSEI